MRLEFDANLVGTDRDHAVTVGFAESDAHLAEQILIQRALPEVEVVPGINGVSIIRGEQRHTVYGGITQAVLSTGSFCFTLSPAAAAKMGGLTEFVVRFSTAYQAELASALGFIFEGCIYEQRT